MVTHIIPEENVPYGEYSGNIDIFLSPSGLIGRRNTAILKELYLGKILYNMKDILAEKAKKTEISKLKSLILKVYDLLDSTSDKSIVKAVETKFKETNDKQLLSMISSKSLNINIIVPPFNVVEFKNLEKVGELLDIPLNEKVYIKELDMWSKEKVPVGWSLFESMEQFSESMASNHSSSKLSAFSAPKKSVDSKPQSIGNLDIFALLTFDSKLMLKELLTSRSDNVKSKIKMIQSIRNDGEWRMNDTNIKVEESGTQNIKDILMTSIGLKMK